MQQIREFETFYSSNYFYCIIVVELRAFSELSLVAAEVSVLT